MKIGDTVVTTGDFYGVIKEIIEDNVIVSFGGRDKSCYILMKKNAIAEVGKAEK